MENGMTSGQKFVGRNGSFKGKKKSWKKTEKSRFHKIEISQPGERKKTPAFAERSTSQEKLEQEREITGKDSANDQREEKGKSECLENI